MEENIIDILQRRDGMSATAAQAYVDETREEIQSMIDEGASYNEIEDAFTWATGLEMDYFLDLI